MRNNQGKEYFASIYMWRNPHWTKESNKPAFIGNFFTDGGERRQIVLWIAPEDKDYNLTGRVEHINVAEDKQRSKGVDNQPVAA